MTSFDSITRCAIGRLTPYARNPRKNDHAVDRMVASIREFGFKIPILARSDGQVVDGHLRLKAAHKLGLADVPVIWCDEWTPAQVKAFRLLVNRSATWADWDDQLLALELADIQDLDFDLALTGFDTTEIDTLLYRSVEDPSCERELPTGNPVTVRGDVWACGDHRILCGDATSAEDVNRVLGSAVPLLMVTDPPYGVEYDPEWRDKAGLGSTRQTGKVANDDRADWTAAYQLFQGEVAYVWHAGIHSVEVARGLVAAGFDVRSQIIWVKQHFALGRGNYHWQHEPCWYVVRRGGNARWCGDRTQSTIWQVANLNPFGGSDEDTTGHGTQKPLDLMKRPILNHTRPGDLVYDPFLGSGTTLIAATLTDRICYGIEFDPAYVDLTVRRWQAASGKHAVRLGDQKTFDELGECVRAEHPQMSGSSE